MLNIDRIIDEQIQYVKNIGCVTNIIDEEFEEQTTDYLDILLENN